MAAIKSTPSYILATSLLLNTLAANSAAAPRKINIYCISNLDGTGDCYEVKTNALVTCTAIPGEVIPCKTTAGDRYNCILFSSPLFACDLVTGKTIESQVNRMDNAAPFRDVLKDVLDDDGIPNGSGNGSNVNKQTDQPAQKQDLQPTAPSPGPGPAINNKEKLTPAW